MTEASINKPDHVPHNLFYDFDIYNFEIEDGDYQASLKRLNASDVPEIFWTPRNGGHWVVTRSVEINKVLNEHEYFSSRTITVPKRDYVTPPLTPLQIDPPNHTKYRSLLAGALSPKAVQALGEEARALSIKLIDDFKRRGECEFISEFAQHLPIVIFMKIVDLPEADRHHLTEIGEATMRGATQEIRDEARKKIAAYGFQKVVERRVHPGKDLISILATALVDGEPIDDYTITGIVTLLLMAGLDTVASTLGFVARFLAHSPSHRQQLKNDPSLIQNAVEELLRRFPVTVLAREVKVPVDLSGVAMQVGDMVVVPTQLDGLDERKFENPLVVDFNRHKPISATFGGGVHRCMGSILARTELRVFLEEWLKRIPDFSVKPGTQLRVASRGVATITSLPLVWDPATTH